jgi:hypothetical protein
MPGPTPNGPAAIPKERLYPYLIGVLLLPVLVLWRQDNTLFTGYGYLDPWYYLGFFRNFVEFKRNLYPATYYGSRLSWVLPGATLHSLFSPVAANCILHLGVHTVATASLFLTLRWLAGARRAFLAAMLFSVNPWLWSATSWDYPDGIAIAYCLLTVALLTWAALQPGRRWALVAAGMAMAGLAYCNLYWVTLAWLLPLGYIAMTWAWHRTLPLRSFLDLCLWFGAGCVLVTVVFGAVNRFLDGHFFFYAPSILQALKIRGIMLWPDGPWKNGAPSAWLLFAAVAVAAAVAILATRWRNWTHPGNAAPVVFSLQLLCALAWMAYTQAHGSPVLGMFYYASDLLPFTFLVIGVRFWPGLESVATRTWVSICLAAAALFGLVWLNGVAVFLAAVPHAAQAGIAALVVSLLFRQRAAGVVLSLAGSALLLAIGVAPRYSGLDAHAYRRQYVSIIDARSHLESIRRGAAVRFAYDDKDRAAPAAAALASTYLWSNTPVGGTPTSPAAGPGAACDVELAPTTLMVAISADGARVAGYAASAVAGCWEGKGLRLSPAGTDSFDRGSYRFTVAAWRVETAPGMWTPVAPAFDSNRRAVLEDAAASLTSPFPPQFWALEPGGDSRAHLRPVPGGVQVQTHATPGSLAALYPVLRAPLAGRYRFAMRYWRIAGAIRFGAYQADGAGRWLASATEAYWDGTDPNLIFWVDLAAGEEFQLAIANHNGSVRLPASFLMKGVNAVRVADRAASVPR